MSFQVSGRLLELAREAETQEQRALKLLTDFDRITLAVAQSIERLVILRNLSRNKKVKRAYTYAVDELTAAYRTVSEAEVAS